MVLGEGESDAHIVTLVVALARQQFVIYELIHSLP